MTAFEYFMVAVCIVNTVANVFLFVWFIAYAKHCTSTLEAHNELFRRRHE